MCQLLIYPLVRSSIGYIPDENSLIAKVILAEDGIFYTECVDWALKEKINSIFNTPIYVRKSNMDNNYFSFEYSILNPSKGEFLEEILYRLTLYNLWGKYYVPKKD